MAILNDNEFTGIPAQRFKISEPIKAQDVRTMAQDQSHVYERLTGLDADGVGTASTNVIHDHTEDGNAMPRILAAWQWGTRGPSTETHWLFNSYLTYAGPMKIVTTTSTTPGTNTLTAFPFYVPTAMVGRDIVLVIECNINPRARFMVYDATDTEAIAGDVQLVEPQDLENADAGAFVARVGLPSGRAWCGSFTLAAAGLHYLVCTMRMEAVNEIREPRSGILMGVYDVKGSVVTPPDAPIAGGNSVDVGDPTASNAWQPIDAQLLPGADGPLHAAVGSMLAENNALIYEKATGLPAPGNTTLTVTRGHHHSGASGEGEELDGQIVTNVLGGAVVTDANIYGQHGQMPKIIATSGSTQIVGAGRAYMHRASNVTSANSRVKFAVLVYNDNSSGTNYIRVDATFSATAKSFNSTIKAGFELLTTPTAGSNIFDFTSNDDNLYVVEARAFVGAASNMRVCGYVFYTEV